VFSTRAAWLSLGFSLSGKDMRKGLAFDIQNLKTGWYLYYLPGR